LDPGEGARVVRPPGRTTGGEDESDRGHASIVEGTVRGAGPPGRVPGGVGRACGWLASRAR
jgi:hypothetical protein